MSDVLPSWRDGATRTAILDFVGAVTDGPDAVPEDARVAVFDNDGTLWTEKPMPTQAPLHRPAMGRRGADARLAEQQPYRAALSGDLSWLGAAVDKHYAGDDRDLKTMIAAIVASTAHERVEDYEAAVAAFYRDARHLTLDRSYAEAVYQPMVEPAPLPRGAPVHLLHRLRR